MGLEGQLHHIIIHCKPVMKSPSSSDPIRKNGYLKGEQNEEGGEEKQRKWKWIKSAKIFRMTVERIPHPCLRMLT